MTINFTIETPFLDEGLIQAAHRRHRRLAFIYLAIAFAAFLVGGAATFYVVQVSQVAGPALLIVFMLLAVWAVFKSASNAEQAAKYVPLAIGWCEDAMALANRHPELEAYRKAVVSARPVMQGDFYAMAQFAKHKPIQDACKALHQVG